MVGDRIRQARLAIGLTLDDIVEQMQDIGESISKQGISNYERNIRIPKPTTIVKLAIILHVKSSYFLSEPRFMIKWEAYRSQTSLGQRQRKQIEASAQSYVEKHMAIQTILYPGMQHAFPKPVKVTNSNDAEIAADKLRKKWNLGDAPIDSVMHTVEDNGGITVPLPMEGVRFDGLSGRVNNQYPVIVVNTSVPDDRLRLDLAHEVGHLVMDCDEVNEKEEEKLAYRFAAAFLVPRTVVEKELGTRRASINPRELALLKQKYGMSMQAWLRRSYDVGITSEASYRRAFQIFSIKKWRKNEPSPYRGNEKAAKLRQLLLHALAENYITPDEAERTIPGCTMEINEVLPEQFKSAIDLMKLPAKDRESFLSKAAQQAADDYMNDPELTAFEIFSEDGLNE